MQNVALLGFGTVGASVARILDERVSDVNLTSILVRAGKEHVDPRATSDFDALLSDPALDTVVECMGGLTPAYEYIKAALTAKKNVVTSNKAVVSAHFEEFMTLAAEAGVNFKIEACVCGGIPWIAGIQKVRRIDEISAFWGIMNGTTNYILTKMDEDGETFEQALTQAQKLGYAERNPEADVEGFDACRKIAILASLATGKEVDFEEIYTEGISKIEKIDFAYAKLFHGSLKLFGSMKVEESRLYAYVCPMMITDRHLLYMVRGVYNGIMIEGNMLGKSMLYGSGAGKLPTASAVVADIIASARHKNKNVPMGWGSEKAKVEDIKESTHQYFVRFSGNDTALIEKCKKAFGEVKVLQLEGEDEFAILTGTMKEDDFKQIVEKIPETIKFIRAIL